MAAALVETVSFLMVYFIMPFMSTALVAVSTFGMIQNKEGNFCSVDW